MTDMPLHIKILQEEFAVRRKRSAAYSMRAFARDLDLSPGHLSALFKAQKGLSELKARALSRQLGLSRTQTRAFLASFAATFARSESTRQSAHRFLESVRLTVSVPVQVAPSDFEQIHNWYYFAIVELVELPDCEHRPEWFAQRLGLDLYVTREALERLQRVKILVCENGRYRACLEESYTQSDVSSDSIKKFHREIMKRAEQALTSQSVLEREFITMTFSFSTARLHEAKQYLREVQNQFIDRFCMNEEAGPRAKDSVYQLSLQCFRLDRKPGDL